MNRPNVLTLIPARGGSKGLPGKNIRPFHGKPLVTRTIETALDSLLAGRILVSTDDEEIAQISKDSGAEVPFLRPAEMAIDASPVLSAAIHALDWLEANDGWKAEWLLLLQPTSPLRTSKDIRDAFVLLESNQADAVVSVNETKSHPFWAKTRDESGFLRPFIEGQVAPARRQDLPPAFALNGLLFLVRVSALRSEGAFCPASTLPLFISSSRSLDIDSELDFLIAEYAAGLLID